MLRDMQALDATLKAKQDTVTNLQAELQSSVAAATVPGGGPELEAEFFKHLTQLSEDHLQDLKERLSLTIDDAAKRRKVVANSAPDEEMKTQDTEPAALPPGQGTGNTGTDEGRARRSRSRGRTDHA